MPLTLNGTTGEIFPSWTTAGRPSTPTAGQTGYNTTLAILETYNGSAWCPFVTTATTFAGNGPAFSAYRSASAQSFSASTWTKLQLQTKEFDTASCYDNATNYRFTPNVAGYYQCNGGAQFQFTGTSTITGVDIYKNGSAGKGGQYWLSASSGHCANASALIYLNGSTDYIEFYVYSNGTSPSINNSQDLSYFQASLVRAA